MSHRPSLYTAYGFISPLDTISMFRYTTKYVFVICIILTAFFFFTNTTFIYISSARCIFQTSKPNGFSCTGLCRKVYSYNCQPGKTCSERSAEILQRVIRRQRSCTGCT